MLECSLIVQSSSVKLSTSRQRQEESKRCCGGVCYKPPNQDKVVQEDFYN